VLVLGFPGGPHPRLPALWRQVAVGGRQRQVRAVEAGCTEQAAQAGGEVRVSAAQVQALIQVKGKGKRALRSARWWRRRAHWPWLRLPAETRFFGLVLFREKGRFSGHQNGRGFKAFKQQCSRFGAPLAAPGPGRCSRSGHGGVPTRQGSVGQSQALAREGLGLRSGQLMPSGSCRSRGIAGWRKCLLKEGIRSRGDQSGVMASRASALSTKEKNRSRVPAGAAIGQAGDLKHEPIGTGSALVLVRRQAEKKSCCSTARWDREEHRADLTQLSLWGLKGQWFRCQGSGRVVGTAGFRCCPRCIAASPGGAAGWSRCPAGRNSRQEKRAAWWFVSNRQTAFANTGQEAAVRGRPEAEPFRESRSQPNAGPLAIKERCRRQMAGVHGCGWDLIPKIERFSVEPCVLQGLGKGGGAGGSVGAGELATIARSGAAAKGRSGSDGQAQTHAQRHRENKPGQLLNAQSAAVVSWISEGNLRSKVLSMEGDLINLRGGRKRLGWMMIRLR